MRILVTTLAPLGTLINLFKLGNSGFPSIEFDVYEGIDNFTKSPTFVFITLVLILLTLVISLNFKEDLSITLTLLLSSEILISLE